MPTIRRVLFGAFPLCAAACLDSAPPTSPTHARFISPPSFAASQTIPNEYLVVLHPGVSDVHAEADHARALGGTVLAEWEDAIQGYWVQLPPQALNGLLNNPNIDWIEPNGTASIDGTETCAAGYVGCSWGLDRIDQHTLPMNLTYNYPSNNASNVHAYILDTGVHTSHQEFGGRASYGYDFIANTPTGDDCNGHGTHVAGTIAGSTYGIAKGASIVAVRVLDCSGSGTWGQIINGINWVTSHAIKPAVANMSLSGSVNSTVDQAVANSVAAGIVYAVAAGNANGDACLYSPAHAASAITVGATDQPSLTDTRASYSNYGTCLDIFAPGTSITSSWNTSNTATNTISGTSMATPHVVGVAALYLAQNPSATASQVTSALVNNAGSGQVANAGTGSPNKLLYMGFLNGGSPPPNQSPSASISSPGPVTTVTQGQSVSFQGSGSDPEQGALTGSSLVWRSSRDGQIGTGTSFSTSALSVGTHTVTLTATDNQGATGTAQVSVTVNASVSNLPPVASFTISCSPGQCTLDGSSSTDDHGVVAYNWSTNDPNRPPKTGSVIQRFSESTLTYLETLVVTDAAGLTNSITKSVTIPGSSTNQSPTASITTPGSPASVTQGLSITFTGSANDPEQGALSGASLVWTSSINGQIGTGTSFATSALSVGSHTITLTATDAQGATGKATVSVTVSAPNQPPTAQITSPANPTTITQGQSITFQGSGTDPEQGALTGSSLSWTSSRDGLIGTGTSFATTSLSVGTHTITLRATDNKGAQGTAQITVIVNATVVVDQPPVANFTVSCIPMQCTLDASSSTDDHGIVTYYWTTDNGARPPKSGMIITRYGSTSGVIIYHETLTVTDTAGHTASITKTITISP